MTTTPADRVPPERLLRARDAATGYFNGLGPGVMAAIPDGVKRLIARPLTIDGNTLDPTMRLAIAIKKWSRSKGLSDGGDPVACRRRYRQNLLPLDRKPVPVGAVTDLSLPGPAGAIPARHYRPTASQARPLLVFFHGGGWVLGDLDVYDLLCRTLCRGADVHVVSVDYRLAPEHPAPAAVDDCYAAFRWAVEHGAELGAEPGIVAVGGDSAGGNLAAVTARLGRDDGIPPSLQVLMYPVIDITSPRRSHALFGDGLLLTNRDMDWFGHCYVDGSGLDAADPMISPLLAESMVGLPPALLVTAGFDLLRDEGEEYGAAMRDAGVVVDLREMSTLAHGFVNLFPLGGDGAAAVDEIASAMRAHLCHG